LAFAEVKPGAVVVDLMPGSGYFTRILSKAVGPTGKVYALQPIEMDKAAPKGLQSLKSIAQTRDYPNVVVLVQPIAALSLPERADLVWTSMNYHDLHDPFMGSPDMKRFNKSVLDALKPGGLFIVLDHASAEGSGFARTDDLHRVEPAAVKAEVLAAGFEFVGESAVLRNSKDDHQSSAFDPAIRGTTDRFIYKFRKPLR
jgi:predicted methyltransferase